jgi:antitoxin (DNA-binding transcriptional repressor) of toxin-antitoxin stability system
LGQVSELNDKMVARNAQRGWSRAGEEIELTTQGTLEAALAGVERQAEAALKAAGSAATQLRKARAAAKSGQLRDLRKALAAAQTLSAELADSVRTLDESFDLDEQDYLASGGYVKELLEAAQAAGVAMFEEDDRLMCYPSLVRVLPGDASVEVDKVRERRIRPSVLVGLLAATQERSPRFKPEGFLDSLRGAYELAVAGPDKSPDSVVRLLDVWSVLTLLPGQSREYSKQEFARDLYLLDQSGVTSTPRSPRRLRWSASTGTKGTGVLTTVARSGQQQRYWGVSFSTVQANEGEA